MIFHNYLSKVWKFPSVLGVCLRNSRNNGVSKALGATAHTRIFIVANDRVSSTIASFRVKIYYDFNKDLIEVSIFDVLDNRM